MRYFTKIFMVKIIDLILIIQENISGDVLPSLNDKDFDELGINKKIYTWFKFNLEIKQIDAEINVNSSENKVKKILNN